MSNTSASGGYILPALPGVLDSSFVLNFSALDDVNLDDMFQAVAAGVTNIDSDYVRPRWQTDEPKQPPRTRDWIALGVTSQVPDAGPYIEHDGAAEGGLGADTLKRHEDVFVLYSMYGPNSSAVARLLRDGLSIPQNMEALAALGIAFVGVDRITTAPEFINQQWYLRYDMVAHFRYETVRTYPVQSIESVSGQLITDNGITADISVTLPAA